MDLSSILDIVAKVLGIASAAWTLIFGSKAIIEIVRSRPSHPKPVPSEDEGSDTISPPKPISGPVQSSSGTIFGAKRSTLLNVGLAIVVLIASFLGMRLFSHPDGGGLYDECFTSTPTPSPAVASSPTPSSPPSVLITAPANGDKVPMQTTVQGTAHNIPKDEELWLFITSFGTSGYFPQPGPILIPNDGQWSTDGHFGDTNETGLRFTLTSVLINQNDQVAHCVIAKYLHQPGPAYQSAPKTSGMQLMAPEVTVVRE